ncbi:SRPBCC family protein [Azospirillum sp. sgz302134]
MARVTMRAFLPVSAQRLWSLVRWDGRLLDWYPGAVALDVEGTEKGGHRRFRLHDGATLVHRLEHLSRIEDAYTYSVLSSPYPVTDHLAQLRVLPHVDGHSILVWTANFKPAGLPEPNVETFVRGLYKDGFDALSTLLSGDPDAERADSQGRASHGPNAPATGGNRP